MHLREGLIWFDNSPRVPLGEKVKAAVAAFERRHRHAADVCYVNPVDLPPEAIWPPGVTVLADKTVLRHHVIVGQRGTARK
jgi:hypothetical protein